jgi:sugar phosphate permease
MKTRAASVNVSSTPRAEADYPRPAYAWHVFAVLTLAYMFSFVDRQIISTMIGPIKRDFALSDAEVGFLVLWPANAPPL